MRTSLFTEAMATLPSDAEVMEITRYTGGLMTPAEALAFENRLITDRAFFCRTAPMLKVWYARKPSPAEERMLRGADARPAVEHLRVVDARRTVDDRQARIRRHLLTALGSAASIKTLMVSAGLAAAVTYAYVNVPRARNLEHASSQAVAVKPSDTTHKVPTQIPPAKTTAVAVAAKHPHRKKGIAPPIQEAQVAVAPMLPTDSAEISLRLPSLGVAFTPSSVIAHNDTMVFRGAEIGAPPRDLGGTQNGIPVPGVLTGPRAPGDKGPSGTGLHWPHFLSPWDWFRH